MKKIDRRKFLRSGALASAAVVAASNTSIAAYPGGEANNYIYRTLGNTGIKVPIVSMGVMRADNPALVRACLDKGITLFDTANGYQGGRNETMLGEIFTDYPREKFYVATKVKPAGTERRTGNPTEATTADDFLRKFEVSMERLKLDYVDILYIHSVSSPELVRHKGISGAIRDLKKQGRVKHIGISTHSNEVAVIDAMIEDGFWDVVLTRYNFNLSYIDDLNAAVERATKAGLGVVAMKTMAGGFFDRERTKPVNTTAALKWALSNPNIHTSIPGMTSFDMLDENIKVLSDIELTAKEKEDLLIAQNEPGLFCTTCNNCLNNCTKQLPVPDLMRAYMYAYGYANIEKAHTLVADLGTGNNPCADCSGCDFDCTKNFDIRAKIEDISRLADVPGDFVV